MAKSKLHSANSPFDIKQEVWLEKSHFIAIYSQFIYRQHNILAFSEANGVHATLNLSISF